MLQLTYSSKDLSQQGVKFSSEEGFGSHLLALLIKGSTKMVVSLQEAATPCSVWLGETFPLVNMVPIGTVFSFFCLLSCNLAQGKKGPYFFQLCLRCFSCGIWYIIFSKVSMGLNVGADTQIRLSLIIRGMRFMLLRTNGGEYMCGYRSFHKLLG